MVIVAFAVNPEASLGFSDGSSTNETNDSPLNPLSILSLGNRNRFGRSLPVLLVLESVKDRLLILQLSDRFPDHLLTPQFFHLFLFYPSRLFSEFGDA